MIVQLIAQTSSPISTIYAAAKGCYSKYSSYELLYEADGNGDTARKFMESIIDSGHESVLEHASFTFSIEGISRACSHQLVRHRLASYSQRSQRYVKHEDFDYITPPSLQGKVVKIEDGREQDAVTYYKDCMKQISLMYNKLNEALGDCGQTSNEEARYILPNACETKMVVTMNARELMHFFNLRLCQRADWEIRGLAESMLSIVKEKTAFIFDGVGPKCVQLGKCPEGRLTCGKFAEMMEKYT